MGGDVLRIVVVLAVVLLCPGARAASAGPAMAPAKSEQAAQPDHAERARRFEEVGKTAAAAREYEAAFAQSHAPEMLYRLALCWRTVGDYKAAREALRGYLREAPEGPLADEVERQLAQIAILIEARGLQSPVPAAQKPAAAKPRPERAAASPAPAAVPPGSGGIVSVEHQVGSISPGGFVSAEHEAALPGQTGIVSIEHQASALPPTGNIDLRAPEHAPLSVGIVSDEHQASPAPSAGFVSIEHQAPAPASAVRTEPAAASASSGYRGALPWLAGGAVALGAAGAILCVGAHEISSSLDSRFNTGALTQADLPRYSKARAEGIAGTAMIGVAVIAAGASAVIAW